MHYYLMYGEWNSYSYIYNLTGLDYLLVAVSIPRRNERGIALHNMARQMHIGA